jgi:hypothetical protein
METKKTLLFVFMCLAMLASLGIKTQKKYAVFHDNGPNVCFKTNCFSVEIADTEAEREKGLMNRESLGENKGMLFVYAQAGIYSFWMKNTLIPLDIIWLDQNGKVVFIKQDAEPCGSGACPKISPDAAVRYVFEANAGVAKKMGLKIGDRLDFINVPG